MGKTSIDALSKIVIPPSPKKKKKKKKKKNRKKKYGTKSLTKCLFLSGNKRINVEGVSSFESQFKFI